jgi:hypothetical protein
MKSGIFTEVSTLGVKEGGGVSGQFTTLEMHMGKSSEEEWRMGNHLAFEEFIKSRAWSKEKLNPFRMREDPHP